MDIDKVVRREKNRQLLQKSPEAAQFLLSRMGIDTVEMQKYQTMLVLKIQDEFEKFLIKLFPMLLEYTSKERDEWIDANEVVCFIADRDYDLANRCIMTYCVVCDDKPSLGIKRMQRAMRLRFKFVPNPDKHGQDKILLQMETWEIPFPKNVEVKFK